MIRLFPGRCAEERQHRLRLLPRYRGKVVEELVEVLTFFQVVEQGPRGTRLPAKTVFPLEISGSLLMSIWSSTLASALLSYCPPS